MTYTEFLTSTFEVTYITDLFLVIFLLNFFKTLILTIQVELLLLTHNFNNKNIFFFKLLNNKKLVNVFSLFSNNNVIKRGSKWVTCLQVFKNQL